MDIEMIHESLVNGQREQMVRQIKEYGLYSFWADYRDFLADNCSQMDAINYFVDATISFFRITER